jgi:hypothetical protein
MKIKMTKKTLLLTTLAVILLAGTGTFAYTRYFKEETPEQIQTADGGFANLDPPTESEQKAGDEQKQKNESQQNQTESQSSGNRSVKPVVTSAGQFDNAQYDSAIEVRTLVTGIYEAGGKCTAEFTQGSHKITRSVEGIQDATTTRCDLVLVPRNEFPTDGNWELTVTYTSSLANGKSDVSRIEIK